MRWDKALSKLKYFIQVRDEHAAKGGHYCRVTFQLTFLEWNVAELPEIVKLAAQSGVDRVKGHHLWTHFSAIENLSMRRSPAAISRWNRAVSQARDSAQNHCLPNGKNVLLENIYPLNPDADKDLVPGGECPFLGQEAWINTEGRFDPCCAPDAQRRTLGDFGCLHEQRLENIWNGEIYQTLLTNYREHSLCMRCNMRKPAERPQ